MLCGLCMKLLPVVSCSLTHEVQQKHIHKHKNVLSYAVSAINIYIVCSIVPYLYYCKSCHNICRKSSPGYKAVLKDMQKTVVSSDHIYKYQVVYQFDIFDLFFISSSPVLQDP